MFTKQIARIEFLKPRRHVNTENPKAHFGHIDGLYRQANFSFSSLPMF